MQKNTNIEKSCKLCFDNGFVKLSGVRYVHTHDGRIITKVDKFRVPCECLIGQTWKELKEGEK
jgi:hypothetical protein